MITLKLSSFTDHEIKDIIARFEIINPKGTVKCYMSDCEKCDVKHVCYSISKAIDYAKAYLEGRTENDS